MARALRSLGRFEPALAIQQQLVDGPKDGDVSEELAELLLATGRAPEARPHFARAAHLVAATGGPTSYSDRPGWSIWVVSARIRVDCRTVALPSRTWTNSTI